MKMRVRPHWLLAAWSATVIRHDAADGPSSRRFMQSKYRSAVGPRTVKTSERDAGRSNTNCRASIFEYRFDAIVLQRHYLAERVAPTVSKVWIVDYRGDGML